MDLLGATPLGLNALVFVLAQWLVVGQRRYFMGQPFIMIWFGFAVIYTMSLLLQWGVVGALELHWFSMSSLWVSALYGIALFPVVCIMLHFTHKILPAPRSGMRFGIKDKV